MTQPEWSPEEEAYADHLIAHFASGRAPDAEGSTIRQFLAHELSCP